MRASNRIMTEPLAWLKITIANVLSLTRRLPWRLLLTGTSFLFLLMWSCERDGRHRATSELRRATELAQTEIETLEARAAAALREANQRNAEAIRALQAERRRLERVGESLRERLRVLQQGERARVEAVASLPTSELAKRLATRLGPESVVGSKKQETGNSASNLLSPNDNMKSQSSKPESPEPAMLSPTLTLTGNGARNLEIALVERDACREQKELLGQQVANCEDRAATNAAIIRQQADSVAQLQQVVALKNEILARQEAAHKAALKAARGTWPTRVARALKYVAVGVVIGVVLR